MMSSITCPKCSAAVFIRAGLSDQGHVVEEYCRMCGWDRPILGEFCGRGVLEPLRHEPLPTNGLPKGRRHLPLPGDPQADALRERLRMAAHKRWGTMPVNNPWGKKGKPRG